MSRSDRAFRLPPQASGVAQECRWEAWKRNGAWVVMLRGGPFRNAYKLTIPSPELTVEDIREGIDRMVTYYKAGDVSEP